MYPSANNQVFLMRPAFVSANRQLLPPAFPVAVPGYRIDKSGPRVGESSTSAAQACIVDLPGL